MKRYGQYCPVARAAEVLSERWTLLVIRELLWGNERFNAIARGVPRMSPSLLTSRLRELERVGLVERTLDGGGSRYHLTAAGAELEPLIEQMGAWGQRWMHQLRPDELDPSMLMLDMSREIDASRLPATAVTVEILLDSPGRPGADRWWLVLGSGGVDACDADPGFTPAAWLQTSTATLTRIWMGDESWAHAVQAGLLKAHGDSTTCRDIPGWIGVSRFAGIDRAVPGLPR